MIKLTRLFASAVIAAMFSASAAALEITDFSEISDMNGDYELSGNITLAEGYIPIGTEDAPFTGTFDGRGHTVSAKDFSSVFGYTKNANIKNMNITGTLSGSSVMGAVSAYAGENTVIDNCSFTGSLKPENGLYSAVGAISGKVDETAVVSGCTAKVSVDSTDKSAFLSDIGGIAGRNCGKILLCTVSGTLCVSSTQYKANLGGVAGENRGTISGCISNAEISGNILSESAAIFAGGITGFNNGGKIQNCLNLSVIQTSGTGTYPAYSGGIAGVNMDGTAVFSKNSGDLLSDKSFSGGITAFNFGSASTSKIENVLNSAAVVSSNGYSAGITPKSTFSESGNSAAYVSYALNISSQKAINTNDAYVKGVYNLGEDDGITKKLSKQDLTSNGLPELSAQSEMWADNSDISALPDLLLIYDKDSVQIIPSQGFGTSSAFYFYCPESISEKPVQFVAAYYTGNRYTGSCICNAEINGSITKFTAENIPSGTTHIRFMAFSQKLSDSVKPYMPCEEKKLENNNFEESKDFNLSSNT